MDERTEAHDAEVTSDSTEGGLRRELRMFDAVLLVMGGVVGAGIFFTPARVAQLQPSVGGIALTWTIGGLLAITGALVFAALGSLLPRTGGQYVYLREAFGRRLAFFYGWSLLTIVLSGAIAFIASICILNVDIVLHHATSSGDYSFDAPFLSGGGQTLAAIALVALFVACNMRGVRLGATVHNVMMVVKIVALVGIALLGLFFVPAGDTTPVDSTAQQIINWATLGPALLAALFCYGGWQNVASVAGEIRDAPRVLPRAILAGTTLIIALYLGLN